MFSVDAQQLKNVFFFQSLNHVDFYSKPRFLIKSGYYIIPSPSTALMDTMTASHDGQAEVAMVCFFSSCFLPTWQCYLLFKVIVGVHIPAVMFLARPIPPCSLLVAAAAGDQPREAME